jgi:hypothetical protein
MRVLFGSSRRTWGLMLLALSLCAVMLYFTTCGNALFAQEDPAKKDDLTAIEPESAKTI